MPILRRFAGGWLTSCWEKNLQGKYTGSLNIMIDAIAVTVQVTKALEAIGVRYFIGGSIASTLYGMVQTTQFQRLLLINITDKHRFVIVDFAGGLKPHILIQLDCF
jgi:hypothetical protein